MNQEIETVRMVAKVTRNAAAGINARIAALARDGASTPPFRRAGPARYFDINGVMQTAGVDVLRNAHYLNGVLQPPLIEGAATNVAIWAEDWSNAIYVKSTVAVTANGATAPDGTVTPTSSRAQARLLTRRLHSRWARSPKE
jgi:hypothetical protein